MRVDLLEPLLRGGRPAIVARIHVERRLLHIEATQNEAAQKGLKRELTLGSATALVVGEVIAVGIFLTPAQMAKSLGTFQQIIAYFIFVTVIFIGLTVAALFVLRRRLKDSTYRAPGYPVTPLLFLSLVVLLLVLIAGHDPKQALLGVAVVGLGLPVYELVVRKRR